jgi:hypothetical protein
MMHGMELIDVDGAPFSVTRHQGRITVEALAGPHAVATAHASADPVQVARGIMLMQSAPGTRFWWWRAGHRRVAAFYDPAPRRRPWVWAGRDDQGCWSVVVDLWRLGALIVWADHVA